MAVRGARRRHLRTWIPPSTTAIYGVTVERSDGTVDTITSTLSSIKVEDFVTESIGNFEFHIYDPSETYANAWTGGEILRFYKDYSATATTLRFRGLIEKVSKQGHKLKCTGRSDSLKFMNITVSKEYVGVECSIILKDMIDNSGVTGFTYSNVTASPVSLTVSWTEKPFWEAVQELCTASGFDAYIDSGLDWHFYESGSVINTTEGIVHNYNLVEVEDFAVDRTLIRNKIVVYGAVIDGVQIMYTAQDTGSQATYGIKEEIINDENVTSYDQAVELGDYLLAEKLNPPEVGAVRSVLLATLQPGEKIRVSSPADKLPPEDYFTSGYVDEIDLEAGKYFTKVYLNKEPRTVSHILKDRVEAENKTKSTALNPFGMQDAYLFLYDEDVGTHSGTAIANGILSGVGTWISSNRGVNSDLNEAYLVIVGTVLSGATVYISADNGVNYQEISSKERITITNPGPGVRVKVVITDSTTEIDSLSMMYK